MMTVLLSVKMIDVLFECAMYAYIAKEGHNSAWNACVCARRRITGPRTRSRPRPPAHAPPAALPRPRSMFYIFSFFKGGLMAVITLLIGTGWAVLKPFLSDREKKILIVALVLQLLTNTAIVMTDELAPGSISFLAWVDVLHIADFIASAAVVIPIAWSLHQLRQSLGSGGDNDGKAAETLSRLELFRNFYLATIAYVYVTRFLVRGARVASQLRPRAATARRPLAAHTPRPTTTLRPPALYPLDDARVQHHVVRAARRRADDARLLLHRGLPLPPDGVEHVPQGARRGASWEDARARACVSSACPGFP